MAAKEYYGIDCIGSFKTQRVTTKPTWDSSYTGRMIWAADVQKYYFGGQTGWLEIAIASDSEVANFSSTALPEILTTTRKLAFTAATGSVTVNSSQKFTFRGSVTLNTTDYPFELVTSASKTYHIRFAFSIDDDRDNFGNDFYVAKSISERSFYAVEVTDTTYNPDSAAETNSNFDSQKDDMLVAKVVTDASNSPTVTSLINTNSSAYLLSSRESGLTGQVISGTTSVAINGLSDITNGFARTFLARIITTAVIQSSGSNLITISHYINETLSGNGVHAFQSGETSLWIELVRSIPRGGVVGVKLAATSGSITIDPSGDGSATLQLLETHNSFTVTV